MEPITWDQAERDARHLPPLNFTIDVHTWMVELRPIRHPELSQVEIVVARGEREAAWLAFQTRNMPTEWRVTEIELDK